MRGRGIGALWAAVISLLVGGIAGVSFVYQPGLPLPDTPVAAQLDWVLASLVDLPTEAEIEERFSGEFLSEIKAEGLLATMRHLGEHAPYSVSTIDVATNHRMRVVITGQPARWRVNIAVEPVAPHRIAVLFFVPATGTGRPEPVTNWQALEDRLARAAPQATFAASEVVEGQCKPIFTVDADHPMSIASIFKLYVLGAAADAVTSGRVRWDTALEIRDDARVHSSFGTESMANGQRVPLEELAVHMIESSDNTAAGLVMEAVGRQAVEAAQAAMGMAEPARNVPFLSAREMSLIKLGNPPLIEEYLSLNEAGRRAFLADRLAGRDAKPDELAFTEQPVAVSTVEWFASASDLCRAHVALQAKGEPVRTILGKHSAIPMGPDATYVAYKGGSELGVLAGSWFVEHRDGRRFSISILLRTTQGYIQADVLWLAADAFQIASSGG